MKQTKSLPDQDLKQGFTSLESGFGSNGDEHKDRDQARPEQGAFGGARKRDAGRIAEFEADNSYKPQSGNGWVDYDGSGWVE